MRWCNALNRSQERSLLKYWMVFDFRALSPDNSIESAHLKPHIPLLNLQIALSFDIIEIESVFHGFIIKF